MRSRCNESGKKTPHSSLQTLSSRKDSAHPANLPSASQWESTRTSRTHQNETLCRKSRLGKSAADSDLKDKIRISKGSFQFEINFDRNAEIDMHYCSFLKEGGVPGHGIVFEKKPRQGTLH